MKGSVVPKKTLKLNSTKPIVAKVDSTMGVDALEHVGSNVQIEEPSEDSDEEEG